MAEIVDDDGVIRTFRHGPSDPPVFADGPGTYAETVVSATMEEVWPAVSDIDLPARFSQEFLGAAWTGDGRGLGSSFIGRNQHPAIGEWEVECFVDAFDEGRVFGWASSDAENPGARWRFILDPIGGETDATALRFEVTLGPGPSGTTMAIQSMPDKESRIIERRIGEVHANMTRTVEGIKAHIENSS